MSASSSVEGRAATGSASASPRVREDELDILKSLSILAVVWIHSSTLLDSSSRTADVSRISRFGVPVFVTIWAYFLERSLARSASPWLVIRQRFVALLIPYVFWSVAFMLCASTYKGVSLWTLFNGLLGGYGWAGQYYFLILLQLLPIFPLLRRVVTPRRTAVVCLLAVPAFALIGYVLWTIPVVQKVHYRLFVYWLPYVAIGVTAARLPKLTVDRRLGLLALAFVLLPMFEGQWLRSRGSEPDTYVTPAVFLSAMGLMYAVYVGCRGLRLPSPLLLLGRNTFGIYVLNPWFVHFGAPYLRDRFVVARTPLLSHVVMPILSVALIVVACLGVSYLLRLAGLGILLGERPLSPRRPEPVNGT